MELNRRGFLSALGLLAAGHVLDPERLLWVPGAKTFFIPETVAVRGNTFLTIDIITREALKVLEQNLKFSMTVNRRYDDRWWTPATPQRLAAHRREWARG